MMNLSFWEYRSWLEQIDHTIIGSGIVGLSCALALRERFPNDRILILEKGYIPQGASTKNAGFACFGSISEILDDLKYHSEDEVVDLIRSRWVGLNELRQEIGDDHLRFKGMGGYEVFHADQADLYAVCMNEMERVNTLLQSVFQEDVFSISPNIFGFSNIKENLIWNRFEGQLDTGELMRCLLKKAHKKDIDILSTIEVKEYREAADHVDIHTDYFDLKSRRLYIATNGFASQILQEDVVPARAQVMITKPIPNLKIKGSFHMYKGFDYFRNVEDRILLGGGRHLDMEGEETTTFGNTERIRTYLRKLLSEVILPGVQFEIDREWSGIMGIGRSKKPIIKAVGQRVFCGVRLGGMGVAIGSSVGRSLAQLGKA